MLLWSLLVLVIVALDQFTKYWVVANIGLTDSIKIIPGIFDFVYVKNTGAAFSFLSQKTYGIVFLSAISIIFCVGVICFIIKKKPQNKLLLTSLGLMFSGALGNLIDRIIRGFVVDFIETTFVSFPVFNIADVSITIGAILLIIYVMFFDKENK